MTDTRYNLTNLQIAIHKIENSQKETFKNNTRNQGKKKVFIFLSSRLKKLVFVLLRIHIF